VQKGELHLRGTSCTCWEEEKNLVKSKAGQLTWRRYPTIPECAEEKKRGEKKAGDVGWRAYFVGKRSWNQKGLIVSS